MVLDFKEATKGLTNEEIRGIVTMATYKHLESILNAALGEYIELGFTLKRGGYGTVELFFKDKKLATYNTDKATIGIVREGCKNYMASLARSS